MSAASAYTSSIPWQASMATSLVAQVADDELVRLRGAELRVFLVHTADPPAVAAEVGHEVAADEPAGAGDESSLGHLVLPFV